MVTPVTTLMDYEAGNLSLTEEVEMVASMVADEELPQLPKKFARLAALYLLKGYFDEEGSINYMKLKQDL